MATCLFSLRDNTLNFLLELHLLSNQWVQSSYVASQALVWIFSLHVVYKGWSVKLCHHEDAHQGTSTDSS